jgi:integrase
MRMKKAIKPSIEAAKTVIEFSNISEHDGSGANRKSGRKVAGQIPGLSKGNSRFWLQPGKLFKWDGSATYSFRVQFRGRRLTFSTNTANRDAAARIAAKIFNDIVGRGIDAVLSEHKGDGTPDRVATIGEWVEAARKVSEAGLVTFGCYSASLRKIAGDILGVPRTKARFGPKAGGAREYRAKIDSASLEILSLPALQKWRLDYVKQAKTPAEERSRMTTANSTVRQAKSLFAEKIVRFLDLHLPDPKPFDGLEYFPRQPSKYFSRIDAGEMVRAAHVELAEGDSPAFLAFLLAISAGLRKAEIDTLLWSQIDFRRRVIRVESGEFARLKSVDSHGEVPLSDSVLGLLRGFKARASGEFVIEATDREAGAQKWGRAYRAEGVFHRLYAWLRGKGVTARKPLHELRKELGALVTEQAGIYAAAAILRHSSVATTERHYADLKGRPSLDISQWLEPENVRSFPSGKADRPARSIKG